MTRILKLLLASLLALTILLGAALGALAWWLSGDGPRSQLEARLSERLGVAATVGQLSLQVWPLPSVTVKDVKLATTLPLSAQQISLRPVWQKLLAQPRELEISYLGLRGLNLPQQGLDQVMQSLSKSERSTQIKQGRTAQNASKEAAAVNVGLLAIAQHVELERVVWQSAAGEALSLSGDVRMNDARDEAKLDLQLGGGSLKGVVRLGQADIAGKVNANASWQLSGELKAKGVDMAALPGLRARLGGRLEATTTLQAKAAQMAGLGAALQTRTAFNVSAAVIKGVDLAKAVRTLGLSRGGETTLQQLSGNLSTRSVGAPMQLTLSELQATSSLLKASGTVNVGAAASAGAPRALAGRVDVDLVAGGGVVGQATSALVGIPLEIGGTTAAPEVKPTRGAMIGGAIGSVMAPVIGTGTGAKLGDKAAGKLQGLKEKLFGK